MDEREELLLRAEMIELYHKDKCYPDEPCRCLDSLLRAIRGQEMGLALTLARSHWRARARLEKPS